MMYFVEYLNEFGSTLDTKETEYENYQIDDQITFGGFNFIVKRNQIDEEGKIKTTKAHRYN